MEQFPYELQWKMDMINGDMYYTYGDEGQWYFGSYTAVNPYINEGWKGLYNVILFANSTIKRYRRRAAAPLPRTTS